MPALLLSLLGAPSLIQKLLFGAAFAGGLFLFGVYEGHHWTKLFEAAQYEKARSAELKHQAEVEAEFKSREQKLIDKDAQLTALVDEVKNEALKNPTADIVCIAADGLRRLNQIR